MNISEIKANSSRLRLAREERAQSSYYWLRGFGGKFFLANRKEQQMQIIIHIPARTQKYRLIIQTQLVEQLLTFYTDLFTLGNDMKHIEKSSDTYYSSQAAN